MLLGEVGKIREERRALQQYVHNPSFYLKICSLPLSLVKSAISLPPDRNTVQEGNTKQIGDLLTHLHLLITVRWVVPVFLLLETVRRQVACLRNLDQHGGPCSLNRKEGESRRVVVNLARPCLRRLCHKQCPLSTWHPQADLMYDIS